MDKKIDKRSWRKLVKKLQRKHKRQKMAQKRDKDLEEAEMEKRKDPLYESWVRHQEEIERELLLVQEKQRQEEEALWLRRELMAQELFRQEESKRIAERLKQEEEFIKLQEQRQKKREEIKLQAQKEAKELDNIMRSMREYVDNYRMKTPTILERSMESRPGEISCEFFDKTNCCGYGPLCSFNHKRPYLSKIILIRHFFHHPLLEQQEHGEYSRSDSELELSERDLREAYDEFCDDVWPVLEQFGTIINFRTTRNVRAHLRGHVFVEYEDKRSALKAFINLQSRYYALKRMNVEFSNIIQWRSGVCGLSLGRKCPKGTKCNFFHLMRNKGNQYNRHIDNPERYPEKYISPCCQKPITTRMNTPDFRRNQSQQSRNWRWSETPEIEIKSAYNPTNNKNDFKTKYNYLESKKNYPSSSQRYKTTLHRRSRSKSQNSRSNKYTKRSTSNSSHDETSKKLRSNSPHSSHHRKKAIPTENQRSQKKTRFSSSLSRPKPRRRSKSPSETHKAKYTKIN